MPRNIRGHIAMVPFPFDDATSAKVRPALCLSRVIGPYRHVVVAYITSKRPPSLSSLLPSDLMIETSHPDFTRTGLEVASCVRLNQLQTVRVELMVRKSGELPDDLMAQVPDTLRRLFDI